MQDKTPVNDKDPLMHPHDDFREMREREHEFTCPYCWQSITMLLDTSVRRETTYIEDCEVCCNPIRIHYQIDRDGFIARFDASKAQ